MICPQMVVVWHKKCSTSLLRGVQSSCEQWVNTGYVELFVHVSYKQLVNTGYVELYGQGLQRCLLCQ